MRDRSRRLRRAPFVLFVLIAGLAARPPEAGAQETTGQDTLAVQLPEIEIEAARAWETEATAPFAVAVRARPAAAVALEPGLSLDDVVGTLPGLWTGNRNHYATGERLVIRGVGQRSSFGVRGIQVVVDGLPLTLPDGQALADIVEPSLVRRAELIRGPASVFWGNASGGVLYLQTDALRDTSYARARLMGGSYGLRQLAAEAAAPLGRARVHAYMTNTEQDGYRDYSAGRFTRAGLHTGFDLAPNTRLRLSLHAADQDAENPGSLTLDQAAATPRMANTRNVERGAGKESLQVQGAATLLRDTRYGLWETTAFGLGRDLDNPLSFAYIQLERAAGGLRTVLRKERGRLNWGFGLDASGMQDARTEWSIAPGAPGELGEPVAPLRRDQTERVWATGAFAYVSDHIGKRIGLSLGLRGDRVGFDLTDDLLDDGDQSGSRIFSAWSPSFGATYRLSHALFFANISRGFETPTTTELINRPDTLQGFNTRLEPQETNGLEVGVRGAWPRRALRFDVALFYLNVRNGLRPLEGADDRTYYVNTAEAAHDGVEVQLVWTPSAAAHVRLAYTGTRLRDRDDGRGRRLPGVPPHHASATLRLLRGGLWAAAEGRFVSAYFVDDGNRNRNDAYTVADLGLGHTGVRLGGARLMPFVRVSNVLDAQYNGSVVVNANGGRFYEPAPGRTVQAGLNVAL